MPETIILVLLLGLVFWIWMLIDCAAHELIVSDKTIWLATIILLNVAGAFAYLILRYRTNRRRTSILETMSFQNDSNAPLICTWCDRNSSVVKAEAQDSNAVSPMHQICPDCFDKFNCYSVC